MKNNEYKPLPDVDELKYKGTDNNVDIKIFVSHRIDLDSATIDNPLYIPIRCGAVYDDRKDVDMLGDDTGDNISHKRYSYCELTVQYWAWKNVDADYYGLCHYRRYLSFDKDVDVNIHGNVIADSIYDIEGLFNFDKDNIYKIISNSDIISVASVDIFKFPQKYKSLYEQYENAEYNGVKYLNIEDLYMALEIIKEKYPSYYETAKQYLNGTNGYFTNLFIMKKKIFNEYCEWLFSILEELEKRIDMKLYGEQAYRTIGHIAERLYGIFVTHYKQNNICIFKELKPILFKNTNRINCKYFSSDNIPIVLAANNKYIPYLSVTINSIIYNSTSSQKYTIFILHTDISCYSINILLSMINSRENINIEFIDVSYLIDKYNLTGPTSVCHITKETYFRFLIQEVLPNHNKIVYLDCDLIVNSDIKKLYNIEIGNNMLGAVYDVDMLGQINMDKKSKIYLVKDLNMKKPFSYFQAGVLIMNLEKFRNKHTITQWLLIASSKQYRLADQDILNKECQGNVKYIDMSWNTLIECYNYRYRVVIKNAPLNLLLEYEKARKNPKIIHYAGGQKPWNTKDIDFGEYFWKYARNTPYYEEILRRFISSASNIQPIGLRGASKVFLRKNLINTLNMELKEDI